MKYREHVTKILTESLRIDDKVLIFGEGVADPKGIFGTTLEAAQSFPDRVIETPLSENMLTGACLGLALEGWKPIFVHARCEFLMPAMEQLVNVAAKWRSVHFDRNFNMIARCLVGRGWGQGPHHSQAFHAMLAHIPGLRVLYPVNPLNLEKFYNEALHCGNPTVIMEPRRMYEIECLDYQIWPDPDAYICTFGDVVLDAIVVSNSFHKHGVKVQVHPIEDVNNILLPPVGAPVLVVDTGHLYCGATAEVLAQLLERGTTDAKRIGPPFTSLPTSAGLEPSWYPSVDRIYSGIAELLGMNPLPIYDADDSEEIFKGPF